MRIIIINQYFFIVYKYYFIDKRQCLRRGKGKSQEVRPPGFSLCDLITLRHYSVRSITALTPRTVNRRPTCKMNAF